MPFKPGKREYRSIEMVPGPAENRFNSEFYVEGHATTFNTPYELYRIDDVVYYEQVDRNAFVGADCSDVIFQYNHEGRVFARLSNDTLYIAPTDEGLLVCADLGKTSEARKMYEDIASGMVTKMSWAFTVKEESYDRETHTRTILKVDKIYDVSAVSIPANDGTDISARSYAEGRAEAEAQELRERENREKAVELERMKLQLKMKLNEGRTKND